jgi:hypothetical protein
LKSKKWIGILVFAGTFTLAARADLPAKRWVLTEPHDDGSRTLVVIDEDPNFRDDPSVLSQHVVFRKKYLIPDAAEFEIAKARFESERPSKIGARVREGRSPKPLWTAVKDEWTDADEDDYSAWFAANVTKSFLRGTGLEGDCADVGLIFRWVYARDHLLPIANTMSGSGKLFGNFTSSSAWDKLATDPDWRHDERFKAAMRELFDETFTWTINDDQYPTLISTKYVRPGSMYMIIRTESGHTQTIASITDSGGIQTIWGNEPAAEAIYGYGLIVEFEDRRGFQNWRHVRRSVVNGKDKWSLIPGDQMPGYSREQFETGFGEEEWMSWVYTKLGSHFGDTQQFRTAVDNFESAILDRRDLTTMGAWFCGPNYRCAATSDEYDGYSSYSRDARLVTIRDDIRRLAAKLSSTNPVLVQSLDELVRLGEVVPGSVATYRDALDRDGLIESWSSDPNESFLVRWGISNQAPPRNRFLAQSFAFLQAIRFRERQVSDAKYYCQDSTCTGDEPAVKALDTSTLDAKIRPAHAEIVSLGIDSSVTAPDRESISALYRDVVVEYLDVSHCVGPSYCTADDVTWSTGAAARVPNWTSKPQDEIKARWGF